LPAGVLGSHGAASGVALQPISSSVQDLTVAVATASSDGRVPAEAGEADAMAAFLVRRA